jgi:O-antigen/teichoic acid export membrane protein
LPTGIQLLDRLAELRRRLGHAELAANAMWSAIGEAIFRGTTLITTAILARLLGASDFGVFGLVRNAAAQFGGVGSVGLGLTANRYLPAFKRTDLDRAGALVGTSLAISTGVGIVLALAGLAASDWIASSLLGRPDLVNAVRLGVVLVALAGISGAQLGVLQGLESFRALAFGYLISGVAGGAALLLGTYYLGLPGALSGLAVIALINLVMFQIVIQREAGRQRVVISWRNWRQLADILIHFSLPTALIAAAIGPLRWLAESMLAKTSGFAEAGLFYAGMIVFSLVVGVVMTLHGPLVSMLARRTAEGNLGRLPWLSLYASWFGFLLIGLPLLLVPQLPGWVLGGDYRQPHFVPVLLLILLYSGMQSYAQGLTRAIAQAGSMWFLLLLSLIESVVLIVAFIGLQEQGALGLATAFVVSYVARLAVTLPIMVRRRVIEPALLLDRMFLWSLAGFLLILLAQWIAHR